MFPIHTYAELEIFHFHTYTVQCKDATYSIVPRLIAHRQLHALTAEVYTTIYLHCPVTGTKL